MWSAGRGHRYQPSLVRRYDGQSERGESGSGGSTQGVGGGGSGGEVGEAMRRLREERLVFQLAFPLLATGLAPVQCDTASCLSSSPPHEQLLLLDCERCPACDLPMLTATCQCRSCPLCAEDCDTHTLTPLASVSCTSQALQPTAQGVGHAPVVGSATRATPNTITSALQSLACDMWTTTLSGLAGGALANVATLARYMPRAAPPRARAP